MFVQELFNKLYTLSPSFSTLIESKEYLLVKDDKEYEPELKDKIIDNFPDTVLEELKGIGVYFTNSNPMLLGDLFNIDRILVIYESLKEENIIKLIEVDNTIIDSVLSELGDNLINLGEVVYHFLLKCCEATKDKSLHQSLATVSDSMYNTMSFIVYLNTINRMFQLSKKNNNISITSDDILAIQSITALKISNVIGYVNANIIKLTRKYNLDKSNKSVNEDDVFESLKETNVPYPFSDVFDYELLIQNLQHYNYDFNQVNKDILTDYVLDSLTMLRHYIDSNSLQDLSYKELIWLLAGVIIEKDIPRDILLPDNDKSKVLNYINNIKSDEFDIYTYILKYISSQL